MDNLWLLGGEIIRQVSLYREHKTDARRRILEMIGEEGGPLCRYLSGDETVAYDGTCRKIWKFLSQESPFKTPI